MALRRGFKTEAESIATATRAELDLTPLNALDPQRLADHLAIPVIALSAHTCPAAVIEFFTRTEQEAFSAITVFSGHHRLIVHNDAHAPVRQRSNITHELCHGLLLHEPHPALDERGMRIWDQDQEDEANYLCGCLLVPRQAALQIARRGYGVKAAAAVYGVSTQMMAWRLNGTGATTQARRERAARSRSVQNP